MRRGADAHESSREQQRDSRESREGNKRKVLSKASTKQKELGQRGDDNKKEGRAKKWG